MVEISALKTRILKHMRRSFGDKIVEEKWFGVWFKCSRQQPAKKMGINISQTVPMVVLDIIKENLRLLSCSGLQFLLVFSLLLKYRQKNT